MALIIGVALLAALAPSASSAGGVLLTVDDGDFFYDDPNAPGCIGFTDDHTQGTATRHWHAGVPFVPAEGPEGIAGFGCLGGPKTWTFTVAPGHVATITGSIKYTWDQNVPGGGFNDVHLHIASANGLAVASTLTGGVAPVDPTSEDLILQRTFSFNVPAGSYTAYEDVFTGEHTAWLTKLVVEEFDVAY